LRGRRGRALAVPALAPTLAVRNIFIEYYCRTYYPNSNMGSKDHYKVVSIREWMVQKGVHRDALLTQSKSL